MFGTYFYNETIKRAVSIFGTCFNNITVKKVKADGTVLTEQKVPISYGPKQKFLERLAEDANLSDGMRSAISLPRLAFELNGFNYDPQRQQNKLIRNTRTTVEANDIGKRGYQYQPAPYDLNFTLSVLAKNMNDALQIVEQILPYFQPEYTVTMKMIDTMTDYRDVPIVLNSVAMNDTYEGGFEERRVIEYTLEFTMKLYMFGPVYTGEVIRNVIERDYIGDGNDAFTSTEIDAAGLVKEVKHYDLSSNPTVSSIAEDKLSIVVSSAITIDANTTLKFVGSVNANDTFVIAETVSFYDDGAGSTFTEDKVTDAS